MPFCWNTMIHSKKRVIILCLALSALTLLQGCDLLRSVFGMPTSKDIAIMAKRLEKDSLSSKIPKDTISVIADSLLSADTPTPTAKGAEDTEAKGDAPANAQANTQVNTSANTSANISANNEQIDKALRYYVVAGSFKQEENANEFV